jgi:hypothetical protein
MPYRCLNNLGGRVVLDDVTPEQVNEYVRNTCNEYYEIPPDVVIFRGTLLSLDCPMLVGLLVKKKKLLVPFSKRCMGSFLIEIPAKKEDFTFFRTLARSLATDH